MLQAQRSLHQRAKRPGVSYNARSWFFGYGSWTKSIFDRPKDQLNFETQFLDIFFSPAQIYLWQLKDNDLIGVAFIDTNIYVHQMVSIKSLILVADVYKSINLLRFQEEYRTLSLVSRDYNMLNVLNVEFMVDNTNLGFLAMDCSENLIIYMYQPESRDSFGGKFQILWMVSLFHCIQKINVFVSGQKLLRKADYHIGQRVNAMFRIQCNNSLSSWNYGNDNKHTTFFGMSQRFEMKTPISLQKKN